MTASTTKSAARKTIAKPVPPDQGATPTLFELHGGLSVEEVVVTPLIASEWLKRNKSNRKIKKRHVDNLRRDMLAGNWRFVGDPVRFDENGDLCDGQHRLLALEAAGTDQPDLAYAFLVLRGVGSDDKAVIDSGVKRSVADQLKMNGHAHAVILAGAARWCATFDRANLEQEGGNRDITNAEVIDYVDWNPDMQEVVSIVVNRYKKKIDMPASIMAACFYILWRVDEEEAKDFFMRIATGVGLEEGDPILALKSRLRDVKDKRVELPSHGYLSLVIRAWNHRREGRTLTTLPLHRGKKLIEAPDPI